MFCSRVFVGRDFIFRMETDGRIEIFEGDITTLAADAIVNAANRTRGGCRDGEAKPTRSYRLPAKYVIHTVGPVWRGGNANEAETLAACYRNCLAIARERGFETVAFPAISTGVYRYPQAVAVREVRALLAA